MVLLKRASDLHHGRCDYGDDHDRDGRGHDRGDGRDRGPHDVHDRHGVHGDDNDRSDRSRSRNCAGDGVATTSNRKDRKDGSSTTAGLLLVWALSHAM
jgi:hypothetical protein